MRKAAVALIVTVVAVVLLAGYETHPPRTLTQRDAQRPRHAAPAAPRAPHTRTATGPARTTPFSVVQVRATLTRGRLTGVQTVALSGAGPHTRAINARAEPILRAEALRAGSARVHAVSGATFTSRVWIASLRDAIAAARR
ncbi:MAG: hypothetical protein QOK21_3970 [Solirubrobacteraceae bacterium]|jgi:uncharacterized protein with FMN-binding domain|nr:hypothetical protein [Solirubrobacteraceae bacterium]